jgi:hypothetical protein
MVKGLGKKDVDEKPMPMIYFTIILSPDKFSKKTQDTHRLQRLVDVGGE